MSDSLLVAVQKYSPKEGLNPIENFTTEAFTWLLRHDKAAEKAFLELIEEKSGKNFNFDSSESADEENQHWETQVRLGKGWADIVGNFDNFIIVVEVKVWSEGSENQVQDYVGVLEKKATQPVYGIYLTAEASQHLRKKSLCGLLWEEVYSKLQQADESKEDWKIQEFLEFLYSQGLSPREPISLRAWRYSGEVINMQEQLNGTFSIIEEKFKREEQLKEKFAQIYQTFSIVEKHTLTWGRIGIHFRRRRDKPDEYNWWNPAVFIGFVIDPTDHKYEDIFEEGAILALIVDIGKSYQNDIYSHKNKTVWSQFAETLKTEAEAKDWEFYKITNLGNSRSVNMYHPLVVYRSMFGIACKTNETDFQKLVEDKVVELLEIFSKSGYQELVNLFDAIDKGQRKTSAK